MRRIKAFLLLVMLFGMTLSPVIVLGWDEGKSLYGTTDSFQLSSEGLHESETSSLNLPEFQHKSQDDTFENLADNGSTREGENFGPPFIKDKRDSYWIDKWGDSAYVDDDSAELVVGVSQTSPDSYAELLSLIVREGGKLVNTVSMGGKVRAVVVDVPLEEVSSFVAEVGASGLSRYVEPNMKFQTELVPNDPYWNLQWGPKKIKADYAWNTTTGNRSVLVAVIDTGIDHDHPDLAANYVPLGYDWVNNDADPMDDHGHGTHCAGIIAAVFNNGIGIAGLAQVRIMAEKGLSAGGWGWEDDLANAIIHAVDQGADILSNSWGGYGQSALIHDAVKYAYNHSVLVIAAAGNSATSYKLYPAAYDEVIAVTATDENDNPAWFTNFGDWVELAAPGVSIYSTVWDDSYTYMSGTSMSTPHVAGVAALIWSSFPNMTRDWVRVQLQRTADDLGGSGFDVYYGYGRVNARKAVEEVVAHDLMILDWERPPYVEPGSSAVINGTILNFGMSNEVNVTAQLLVNGTIVNSTSISSVAGGASVKVSCSWNPFDEGLYNVTFYIVPVPGENVTWNNVKSTYIAVGFPLKAFVLDSAGTDLDTSTWEVLNTNWYKHGGTLIYIDYETLNIDGITYSDIAATDADVLIISCAYSWEFTDSEIEAITRYVQEGHGLIATAGTLYRWVPNNNKMAPLFGLNETVTWDVTGTDLLDILVPTHPLFVNIPNPYVMPEVATAIPSDRRWDSNELAGGTYVALGHNLESAVVVYRGLVFISPWLESIPAYYHHHMQLLYNAITWSEYQKPEHELTVSLEYPAYLKPGGSSLLNATVYNGGLSNETSVELQLLIDDSIVNSTTIPELLTDSSYTLNYLWTPTVEATYNVTAYAPPVPGENFTWNNLESAYIPVSSFLVIFEEAHLPAYSIGTNPAFDVSGGYAEFAKYLIANGYAVSTINTGTTVDSNVLAPVDVLVIVAPMNSYSSSEIDAIENWVKGGGNLLLISDWDDFGRQANTIAARFGFSFSLDGILDSDEYVGGYTFWPYYDGANLRIHPITAGVNRVEMYAGDGIESAPLDEVPLIVTDSDGTATWFFNGSLALGVSVMSAIKGGTAGSGKLVIITDSNIWDSAYDIDVDGEVDFYDSDNEILALNSINWLLIQYEHELAVFLDSPTFLKPSESSLLNATVYNLGLHNETVDLFLMINGVVANSKIGFKLVNGTSYTIDYLWTPSVEATYNVTAYVPPVPGENFTINNVATKIVSVRSARYVLFDQTHGTDNIISYQTWVTRLTSRGYVVETHTTGSITSAVLAGYDVFVIPQASSIYSSSELAAIQSFVFSGGGLLVIGDNYPSIYTDLTSFAGISWMSGGTSGITTDITPHEVTKGVTSVYLSSPIAKMQVTTPALDLVRDPIGGIMLAVSEMAGRVIGFADEHSLRDWGIINEDNLRLANNMIDWLTGVRYEHELSVYLEAPDFLEPSNSSLLNATVYNRGLNNETVELYLLIDGVIVNFTIIPELINGTSYTINYLWTPVVEATYNVTAYAPPVPGENVTINNVHSISVTVQALPKILIVADNDGWYWDYGTSQSTFESALKASDYGYLVWNESSMGHPSLEYLARFELVIWTCGDYRYVAVDEIDAETLESYLAQGGNILLEGGDIGYNHGSDSFMVNVAHAIYKVDDTEAPGLTVTASTHPVTYKLSASFTWSVDPWYDDGVSPTNGGKEVIKYTGTTWTAVTVFSGGTLKGSVVYYAFPLRCLKSYDGRKLAINSINWLLGIDKIPPTLYITKPEPNAIFTSADVTVVWIGDDYGSGIDKYTVRLNEEFVANTTDRHVKFSGLLEGSYTVTVIAYDKAGNSAQDQLSFAIDLTAPSVDIAFPEEDYATKETNITVVWTGSDANGTGISYYLVYLDGIQAIEVGYISTASNQSYTLTNLVEGDHTIRVEAHDLAGYTNSDEITVTVDKTVPTLTIISPENGTNVVGSITIRFFALDANLLNVTYFINGGAPIETTGETSFTINTTTLMDGSFSLSITATDRAGNSATETITLVADNNRPMLAITAPKEGAELVGTITIEFIALDINLDKVFLYIDNAEFNVTETNSYSWDTTSLGDGNHTIRLIATDRAGNTAETSVTVNVINVRHAIEEIRKLYLAGGIFTGLAIGAIGVILVYAFLRRRKHRSIKN